MGMQKEEVKRYLESQASLASEYKMKQGKDNTVKRTYWSQQTPFSNNTRDNSTHACRQLYTWMKTSHEMVNMKSD